MGYEVKDENVRPSIDTVRDVSTIFRSIAEMKSRLGDLRDQAEQLEDRLKPVMGPMPPAKEVQRPENKYSDHPSLHSELMLLQDTLDNICSHLQTMLGRLVI